jgi:hypothetical protein
MLLAAWSFSRAAHRVQQLRPGNSVPVLYDPALPTRAKWDSTRVWALPAAIMAVAVIAFGVAMFPDVMARPLR